MSPFEGRQKLSIGSSGRELAEARVKGVGAVSADRDALGGLCHRCQVQGSGFVVDRPFMVLVINQKMMLLVISEFKQSRNLKILIVSSKNNTTLS